MVLAKSALEVPHAKVVVPYIDFKHCINQYILSTWQDNWNGAVANKLNSVKPVLGDWQSSHRRCRKDGVVLCRACIDHTDLTLSHILKKNLPPQCEHCQCILTVRHMLVVCNNFAEKGNIYLVGEMIVILFNSVSFIIRFNLYIKYKLFLHSSLHCVYNLVHF